MILQKNKLFILGILLIILMILITGCWDYRDIDQRSIILSIGVDRVKDKIQFITETAKLKTKMGEESQKLKPPNVYNESSYGKNFEEARLNLDVSLPYPTFLGATRVCILGPNLAKEGVKSYLNRINKFYDYRKTLLVVISRENPNEILTIKAEKDISMGFLIENIIKFLSSKGLTLYPTVGNILSDIALQDIGYLLPYIGVEEETVKYLGLAVMKDSKIKGIIKVADSKGLLYILADKISFTEVLPNFNSEEDKYSMRLTLKDRNVTTDYINDRVVINVKLDLNAQLQYQYQIDSISEQKIKRIEKLLASRVENQIKEIIKKSQWEYECDIFEFVRTFRAENHRDYVNINWEEEYPAAKVNVSVGVNLINQNMFDPNAKNMLRDENK